MGPRYVAIPPKQRPMVVSPPTSPKASAPRGQVIKPPSYSCASPCGSRASSSERICFERHLVETSEFQQNAASWLGGNRHGDIRRIAQVQIQTTTTTSHMMVPTPPMMAPTPHHYRLQEDEIDDHDEYEEHGKGHMKGKKGKGKVKGKGKGKGKCSPHVTYGEPPSDPEPAPKCKPKRPRGTTRPGERDISLFIYAY